MKIVIIGSGDGYQHIKNYEKEEDTQIWVTASIFPILRSYKVDKIFEMHQREKWQSFDYNILSDKLVLPYLSDDAPSASHYPLNTLESKYGVLFSSTISWILGEALETPNVEEIVILGVDMDHSSEYSQQRDGLFFLLGYAKAYGIEITIPETSKINIFGQQYGH